MIFRWYYLLNNSILWEEGKKQKESWLVANLSIDFCLRLLFSSSRSSSTRTTKKEKSLTIDLKFPSILIVFLISSVKCRTPWAPITFQARFLLLTNVYYQTDTLVLGQKKKKVIYILFDLPNWTADRNRQAWVSTSIFKFVCLSFDRWSHQILLFFYRRCLKMIYGCVLTSSVLKRVRSILKKCMQ